MSPTEIKQAQKFNLSTAAKKGVDPLLTKKAAGVVAIITALIGGYMGKEIAVDEVTIDQAMNQGLALYTAVMGAIAAVTWFYKFLRNIYTEFGRIRQHGVKIAGPNADLSFDFAPKDNGK